MGVHPSLNGIHLTTSEVTFCLVIVTPTLTGVTFTLVIVTPTLTGVTFTPVIVTPTLLGVHLIKFEVTLFTKFMSFCHFKGVSSRTQSHI